MMDLDTTFAALGDQTRRAILGRLADGEAGLSELAEPFAMSQTAVSKHVGVLREAGLVVIEKRGRTRYCRLNAEALRGAADWLAEYETFWTEQVANLADHLAQDPQ